MHTYATATTVAGFILCFCMGDSWARDFVRFVTAIALFVAVATK